MDDASIWEDGAVTQGLHAQAVAELVAAEELRCRAISAGDTGALESLLDEDLTHTHLTGRTQSRAQYLASLREHPRRTERTSLDVRVHGDTAVVTGRLRNIAEDVAGNVGVDLEGGATTGGGRVTEVAALAVWRRSGGRWRMVAFAASGPVREPIDEKSM